MLKIIQFIEMYFLWGKVTSFIWWSLLGLVLVLYVTSYTYGNITLNDDEDVKIFWYKARIIGFIIDVVLTIGIAIFLFLR